MVRTKTLDTVQSFVRRSSQKRALGIACAALVCGALLPSLSQAQPQKAALPDKLEFEAYPIVFKKGVAAGGRSHLTLYPDGHYHYSGHFHVSGPVSYDLATAWMVRTRTGQAFLFSKKGRMHATFEPGSRNVDWDTGKQNDDIRRSWADLAAGSRAECRSHVNMNVSGIITEVKQAVEVAGQVVQVVEVAML